jgi:cytochrome c-type biogenesis protein CcmH
VEEEAVTAVARQLRCVVCQNLSVADSPSEMARQMRDLIREQLVAGSTPAEVTQYFVARYGEWVLLAPPPRGFNLVLWGLPFVGLVGGLGLVLVAARRWSRRASPEAVPEASPDPADRARVRAELERLRD